jgi:hypothetical protein
MALSIDNFHFVIRRQATLSTTMHFHPLHFPLLQQPHVGGIAKLVVGYSSFFFLLC